MTREEIKKSGLLDQYVLGLTSPEQTELVERLMREDPFLAGEVDRLRNNLFEYADSQDIAPPKGDRKHRTMEDFHSLDHEMILEMTERNHSLNIWRFVLGGVCLLLLCLSGYLFRLKENYRADLLHEEALHAQDVNARQLQASELPPPVDWSDFSTESVLTAHGAVLLHRNPAADHFLLDLSHLSGPETGSAYFLTTNRKEVSQLPTESGGLIPRPELTPEDRLEIWTWPTDGSVTIPDFRPEDLIGTLHPQSAGSEKPAPAPAPTSR